MLDVRVYVHPQNGSNAKMWMYATTAQGDEIAWGSLLSGGHQKQVKAFAYGAPKAQEKLQGGYVFVGSFPAIDAFSAVADTFWACLRSAANGSATPVPPDWVNPMRQALQVAGRHTGLQFVQGNGAAPMGSTPPPPRKPLPKRLKVLQKGSTTASAYDW